MIQRSQLSRQVVIGVACRNPDGRAAGADAGDRTCIHQLPGLQLSHRRGFIARLDVMNQLMPTCGFVLRVLPRR